MSTPAIIIKITRTPKLITRLINADIEGDVTYSFIVDGKHVQTGFIIQKTQINEP